MKSGLRRVTAARDDNPGRVTDVGVTTRGDLSRLSAVLLAVIALALTAAVSIFLGTKTMSPSEVFNVLIDPSETHSSLVIWSGRIPRTIVGVLVGAGLGLAGALMQAVTRNPLADPGLLGVNAGAAAGVVAAIHFQTTYSNGYIWAALIGAALTAVVVFAVGASGGRSNRIMRMTLAGVAVNAVMMSVVSSILLLHQPTMESYRFWALGAIAGRSLDVIVQTGPFLVAGILLALSLGPSLNILSLGEDLSAALGTNVAAVRSVAIVATVLLSGAATATAGPIGFVGLVVPHIVRLVSGNDQRWILSLSVILSPVLLLWADIVGRIVASPGEIEVGIVIAVIGGPFFVYLVRRKKLVEL